jgi:hypothetical protein
LLDTLKKVCFVVSKYHQSVKFVIQHLNVEELLCDKDVNTTMVYTHVSNRGGKSVKSPGDDL